MGFRAPVRVRVQVPVPVRVRFGASVWCGLWLRVWLGVVGVRVTIRGNVRVGDVTGIHCVVVGEMVASELRPGDSVRCQGIVQGILQSAAPTRRQKNRRW